jgi:signal peptidase I
VVDLKKLWKNDYFRTAVAVALIIAFVGGIYVGMVMVLGLAVPIRVVESGSMCVPQPFGQCDGWSNPFSPTLHVGDVIIIQKVDVSTLNADYPNSDFIVYKNPSGDTPIVHRIVSKQDINGTLYFKTKGDGNGPTVWPNPASSYDNIPDRRGVPQDLVEGKVIFRVPYVGWITLFFKDTPWALPLIAALAILLVAFGFMSRLVNKKRKLHNRTKQTARHRCLYKQSL